MLAAGRECSIIFMKDVHATKEVRTSNGVLRRPSARLFYDSASLYPPPYCHSFTNMTCTTCDAQDMSQVTSDLI